MKENSILGVIPARYGSTRFPAKALTMIDGLPMVVRVYRQAIQATLLSDVVIATDHKLIEETALQFGCKVKMTGSHHPSGTDRCMEVLSTSPSKHRYLINIQGDEPYIDPKQIDLLAGLLDGNVELATLVIKASPEEDLTNPNVVKVIFDQHQNAIYFSRWPIPYQRNDKEQNWNQRHPYYRHIGMYAYRSDVLQKITSLAPSYLENSESLEQLRWLEHGYKIKIGITDIESHSVDVPEDLIKLKKFQDTLE